MNEITAALSRRFHDLSKHSNSNQSVASICSSITSRGIREEEISEEHQSDKDSINWCPARDFLQLESSMVSHSFAVDDFGAANNGKEYQQLVDKMTDQLKAHIESANLLIEANEKIAKFEESTEELIRLAIGRTQLLINKRVKQFVDHLHQYLHPVATKKPTKLEDLHGLWALIEMQMDDIRRLWTLIERCRLDNWKCVASNEEEKNNNNIIKKVRFDG